MLYRRERRPSQDRPVRVTKAPGTQTVTCDDHVLAVTKNGLSSCMALVQLQGGKTTQITLINSGLPTMFVNASISSAVR